MTASICMDCQGPCTAHGHPKSHGLCEHCLAKRCPNLPKSIRHMDAMRRGAEAFARGRFAQVGRIEAMIAEVGQ